MTLQSDPPPGTPLPTNDFPPGTSLYDAYKQCRDLELMEGWNQLADDLIWDFSESAMQMPPMTVARVLGHALRHAPNTQGRDVLAREIMGCKITPQDPYVTNLDWLVDALTQESRNCNPELLAGLAYLYVFGLIRIFYNPKGPTPYTSVDQSPRRSFEQAVNDGTHLLRPSLVTTTALRDRVLYRDENRCVLTGGMNVAAFLRTTRRDGLTPQVTQTAHIISQSFSSGIGGMTQTAQRKCNWASTAAAVLERFGGFSADDILGDDDLNNAANAFTVGSHGHTFFDGLYIWLVPATDSYGISIPNSYNIQSVDSALLVGFKQTVTFREAAMGDIVVQPPSPQLLALHTACAQVAHLSAAAEHLDDIFGDPDTDCMVPTMVMTQPGSAAILTKKLTALSIISSVA